MKFLVFSDVHGDISGLKKVLAAAANEMRTCDAIICNGDFTDMFKVRRGLQLANVRDAVALLVATGKATFCVPGNHDPHESIAVFEGAGTNLHGKRRTIGGFDFVGFGGATTPFNTNFEPSDEETYDALDALAGAARNPTVFVLHAPAKDCLDGTGHGMHVGSETLRGLIAHHKPVLALSAHIHEAAGTAKLGETTVFYPGPLYEGFYGVVTLEKGKAPGCLVKRL